MSSRREQILARIQAALIGNTPAGANVFRARENAITRAMTPAITVLYDGQNTTRMGQATDKQEMRVKVAIFVRGDPWDQVMDPIDVAAHAVIMSDAPLAALAVDIRRDDDNPESEEADRTAGTLSVIYRVTYLNRAADIAAAP